MVAMAFTDYVCVRLFLLTIVTVEWKVTSSSFGDEENPTIPDNNYILKLNFGKMAKMVYKPRTKEHTLNALKFGHWTWNKTVIVADNYFVIGNNTKKKRFWLKIRNVNTSDSGIYSFVVNGTVVSQWQLLVRKASLQGDQPQLPCGGALPKHVTSCVTFSEKSFPNCRSFPGPPLNVTLSSYIYKGKPVVQVTWEAPNTGFSDLWGYNVYITGKDSHPGHYDCLQINSKTKELYWIFLHSIMYGATYMITVQSMPAHHKRDKNEVSMDIRVPERCQFLEYRNSSECCSLVNITAEYIDKKMFVTWAVPLKAHCREINTFIIKWNNIQKPKPCHGIKFIKGTYNYTILLKKEECSRFNYSIKVSGKINKTETKTSTVTVLIPPMIYTPPSYPPMSETKKVPDDNTTKILIAVFGTFFGLVICTLLVVYRVFFQPVSIRLPDPPSPRPNSDQPLLDCDSGKKRVFIMHTRCCEKCSHVVHCLGTVLNSTELIEPSIDMWSTLDISPNVPRWYEDQVKKSDCVIILGSRKMSLRCQNTLDEGDDPLKIKCQLNFIRGNIANNPDSHRFIPAFFTCNGSKKDIPDFLCDRWSHRLPKEVDRVIFHVLNVEKIQPYRTQPIVVMGGNGHPFDEKKKELEWAVQEAEIYHKNNVQV